MKLFTKLWSCLKFSRIRGLKWKSGNFPTQNFSPRVKISAHSLSSFPLSPSLFHAKTLHSRCPPLYETIADRRLPAQASVSGAQPPKTAWAKAPPPYSPRAARKCGEKLKCCSLSRSIPPPSGHLITGELHHCIALSEENKAHPTSSLFVARNFPFRRHVLHRFFTFPCEQDVICRSRHQKRVPLVETFEVVFTFAVTCPRDAVWPVNGRPGPPEFEKLLSNLISLNSYKNALGGAFCSKGAPKIFLKLFLAGY